MNFSWVGKLTATPNRADSGGETLILSLKVCEFSLQPGIRLKLGVLCHALPHSQKCTPVPPGKCYILTFVHAAVWCRTSYNVHIIFNTNTCNNSIWNHQKKICCCAILQIFTSVFLPHGLLYFYVGVFGLLVFFNTLSQWEKFLMGNSGRFPQGQLQQSRYPTLINYEVHAGSFRVSVIHQTLTWTTGSLSCVSNHSYASVYTRGLGTPTASQHNI